MTLDALMPLVVLVTAFRSLLAPLVVFEILRLNFGTPISLIEPLKKWNGALLLSLEHLFVTLDPPLQRLVCQYLEVEHLFGVFAPQKKQPVTQKTKKGKITSWH